MTSIRIWNNVVAYALQIGLLVGIGALVPPLLKLGTPRAKLLLWQALLVACLLLPWVQPWRQEVVSVSNINILTALEPVSAGAETASSFAVRPIALHHTIPFTTIALYLLAAGAVVRLAWLCAGLIRLAGYRRRGNELPPDPVFRAATTARARWLVSEEIPSPVTFGWRDPVVLLPARFLSLQPELREAILCHELIHVERNDWLVTLAEEFTRALFWFHPAVWWVLGEIQLAREQTVDHAVVEITHAPGHYLDALLAMAGAASEGTLDLAPAPLFLRRRHLKQRVMGLLQEARSFSGIRLLLTQAAAIAAIGGGCWVVSGAFPLAAAPQLVADAPGVIVNTGDAKVWHRTPVAYPPEARANGVHGRVVIETIVDADGRVSDKTEVDCLWPELCDAASSSLANWQFDPRQANTTHTVSIDFVSPPGTVASAGRLASQARPIPSPPSANPLRAQAIMPVAPGLMASRTLAQVPRANSSMVVFQASTVWLDGAYVSARPAAAADTFGHMLTDIRIAGLSDPAASQLKSRLPVQSGDVWSTATASIVGQMVADFDPHLEVDMIDNPRAQQWSLWIGPALATFAQPAVTAPPLPAGVYLPGGGVRPPALLSRADPDYADSAKSVRISGTVTVSLVVGTDGRPRDIQVIGPLEAGLDQSAVDALSRWRFRPGTKDGVPANIQAQVNFIFRML